MSKSGKADGEALGDETCTFPDLVSDDALGDFWAKAARAKKDGTPLTLVVRYIADDSHYDKLRALLADVQERFGVRTKLAFSSEVEAAGVQRTIDEQMAKLFGKD
jgi:hypothetical protein